MGEPARKSCIVAYATPERQYLWSVELAVNATIGDAINAARRIAGSVDVPWETANVGIFGELRSRTDVPADGDRIEIYRPLQQDPKESRRERVKRLRTAARGSRG